MHRLQRELRFEVQLLAAQRELSDGLEQQDQLLKIVAGLSELDTLLAEINDLAEMKGVTITRAVPGEFGISARTSACRWS